MCDAMDFRVYNVMRFFKNLRRGDDSLKLAARLFNSPRMTNESEYLLYLLEQQALICRSCQYCLQPDGVRRHLQRKHQAIPLKGVSELCGKFNFERPIVNC